MTPPTLRTAFAPPSRIFSFFFSRFFSIASSFSLLSAPTAEDEATTSFRRYCEAANISIHPGLRLGVPTARAPRGVVAAQALSAGETLVAVPLGSMLTVEHAVVDPRFAPLWQAIPDLSDMDLLAAYIASETVQHNSSHSGYLAYLPRQVRDALHLGPVATQLLQASPTANRLARRLEDMAEVGRAKNSVKKPTAAQANF